MTETAATALVSLQGLSRAFPTPTGPLTVLNDVHLSVAQGSAVAIMGRSGSGKSTLLNILGLLDRSSSGRYLLAGDDTTELSERRRARLRSSTIGFVFQEFHLLDDRSALENVALGSAYQGVSRSARIERAAKSLSEVGLEARSAASVSTLSGGEKQRVAIARATAAGARLLLCDEPTGNLDATTGADVLEILLRLREEAKTIVIVTHDPAVARETNRVLHLEAGRLDEYPKGQAG